MKIKNKKGFGLIMAIMIVTILVIMAAGFFTITDYSNKSVAANTRNLRLYWAAESASNYNVNWWVNLPDNIRKDWPAKYLDPNSKGYVDDRQGTQVSPGGFYGATDTAQGDTLYLHVSSLLSGNTNTANPDLENYDGFKLITTRYKGPRKNAPHQAVWVLDSYAYDQKTGDISNIVLSNVYNYKPGLDPNILEHAELVNQSLAGANFQGTKGRYSGIDFRYGPCWFGDIISLDYGTGADKFGPTFYWQVKSASQVASTAKTGNFTAADLIQFNYGLSVEGGDDLLVRKSFLAGTTPYLKQQENMDLTKVTWNWPDVVKYGPPAGVHFLDKTKVPAGSVVTVKLVTVGNTTTAEIYKGSTALPEYTVPLGPTCTGIAVDSTYGDVKISGESKKDFTLITQKSTVRVIDDFYISELKNTSDWLQNVTLTNTDYNEEMTLKPAAWFLESIYLEMKNLPAETGHLAVIQGLGLSGPESNDIPILFDKEDRLFTTAAYVTKFGQPSASKNAATNAKTKLRIYNIGPALTLSTQVKEGAASQTAGKYSKVFIQDERYARPNAPRPPFFGESPGLHPHESLFGLNPNHRWSRGASGEKTTAWQSVVWRNGYPSSN